MSAKEAEKVRVDASSCWEGSTGKIMGNGGADSFWKQLGSAKCSIGSICNTWGCEFPIESGV